MKLREKIIPFSSMRRWRDELQRQQRTLVVTNGCFDLLHAGHVTYLEEARRQGDVLLVGLNGDEGVRRLKGKGRPLNPEEDRAAVLAALEAVDAVTIFPEARAVRFLEAARPDVYIKGGDYTVETLDAEEREVLEAVGARIVFIPFVAGKSTSALLRRIQEDAKKVERGE